MTRLRRFESDFDRYDWLMNLADRNKELFFRLMNKHADYIMPLVYTPTVGLACQNLSLVYNSGRLVWLSLVADVLSTYGIYACYLADASIHIP